MIILGDGHVLTHLWECYETLVDMPDTLFPLPIPTNPPVEDSFDKYINLMSFSK